MHARTQTQPQPRSESDGPYPERAGGAADRVTRSAAPEQGSPQRVRILLAGTSAREAHRLRSVLDATGVDGFALDHARSLEDCPRALGARTHDLIVLPLRPPRPRALSTLTRIRHLAPNVPIVVLVKEAHERLAHAALEAGAEDYLVKERMTPDLLVRTLRYVIELHEAAVRLSSGREHYQLLYVDGPFMFFTLGPDGTILSANRYVAEQLGYTVEELTGTPLVEVTHNGHKRSTLAHLKRAFATPQRVHRWEAVMRRRDGQRLWMRQTARVVRGGEGAEKLACVCEDVTEARNLSQQLSYQASHDALTGLVNRREFERRLQRVLDIARNDHTEHALCYLDLDQFKIVNDTCGHIAGDELLRKLGSLLQGVVRKRDTLARLGGDEFGVLMEYCTLQQAQRVAEALHRAIENFRFNWEDKTLRVSASIGMVPINDASENISSILSAADAACYAAKEHGRNRIHVYHEGDSELARRYGEMQWVTRIERALEEDRFELEIQPIAPVDALDEPQAHMLHYEVLLRMRDEHGRVVLPGAFLPAAERYDLARHVDRWVINTAFSWLGANPKHVEQLYLCCINLSARSVGNEDFLSYVIGCFDKTGVPPEKVCFEITETAAIANLASAARFIRALKEWGCCFALDDFGSGLSSFAYLKNLPVDFLKIDGVFVRGVLEDPVDLAMVKSINEIGQAFGKKTIAEFVESNAILEKLRLRYIGVDYAQGYGVGRPQPLPAADR